MDQQHPMHAHFADVLRQYWRFDQQQAHTHSYHDREDFIRRELPKLLLEASRPMMVIQEPVKYNVETKVGVE